MYYNGQSIALDLHTSEISKTIYHSPWLADTQSFPQTIKDEIMMTP